VPDDVNNHRLNGYIQSTNSSNNCDLSLYVLNAAGLSKQHAVEHLAADLNSYGVDIAVITETHFCAKHMLGSAATSQKTRTTTRVTTTASPSSKIHVSLFTKPRSSALPPRLQTHNLTKEQLNIW